MKRELTIPAAPGSAPRDLEGLRRASASCGRDLTLTQGAGGNTSIKQDGALWVKASGTWLAEAEARDIFLPVGIPAVLQRLAAGEDDCTAGTVLGNDERRASIEAPVHAVLPQRVILHLHCVETIAHAVRSDAQTRLATLLGATPWMWVPYQRPGAPLARQILELMRSQERVPDILILENHGLFVCGDTVEAAMSRLDEIRKELAISPASQPPARLETRSGTRPAAPPGFRWLDDKLTDWLAFDAAARSIAAGGVLYPDHMVFLGPIFSELGSGETIERAIARWRTALGTEPIYLVVPDAGVLVAEAATPNALAMLQCLGLVTARLRALKLTAGDLRYLSPAETGELVNWDAEIYRQKLALLGGSPSLP